MKELRDGEPARAHPVDMLAASDAGDTGMMLDPAHRHIDGAGMGVENTTVTGSSAMVEAMCSRSQYGSPR